MPRSLLLMFLTAAVLTSSGCQTCCRRPVAVRTTAVPGNPCPPGGIVLPPPPTPIGGPPPGLVPGPGTAPPPIAPPPFAPSVKPVPPGSASMLPRFEPNWQPADARGDQSKIAQAIPDPLQGSGSGTGSPSGAKLYPPEVAEKSTAEPPLIDDATRPGVSPPAQEKKAKTTFPVGIPQFARASPGVTSGLRPSIDDGLDWLAANDYRTVLHLRAPGEPESADRKQVEKLSMAYISMEISPQTLTRERFEEFAKSVRDVARQPLFVYDQDGSIAGPLWYLYFRKVGNDDDDVARIKANGLGLRADRDGAHRLMWLAAQKYLEANP